MTKPRSYRNNEAMDSTLRGARSMQIRGSVREGTLTSITTNETADVALVQSDEQDALTRPMNVAQGIGYVARPKDPSLVQVVVVNVSGNADVPIGAGYLDWNRNDVLEAAGIEDDATDLVVIYNSTRAIQILPDGSILIGAPGGTQKRLLTEDDYATLKAHIDGHIHLTPTFAVPTGAPSSIPSTGTAFVPVPPVPDPTPAGQFTTHIRETQ